MVKDVGMIPTPEIPTQLQPGRHYAVFRGGPRLFVELDGSLCSQATPEHAIRAIVGAGAGFEEDFPVLARVLASPLTGIFARGAYARVKAVLIKVGLTFSLKAGVIILVYIAIHLVIRWMALQVHHRNSRDGGVLIEYGPPYWPVEFVPQIFPRGGYKGDKIEKGKELARQKLGQPAKSAVDAVASKMGTIKPAMPNLPGRPR